MGKNELPRRWAFLATDRQGVLGAIDRYLAGERDAGQALAGSGPEAALARETALAWTHGGKVDWGVLADDRRLRRLPLPAYPFAQVSCWVDQDPSAPSVIEPLVFRHQLHPFLGQNESDVDGLRYGMDVHLDDLLDYTYLHDKERVVVPTFLVDAALACASVSGFGTGARIRDLHLVGRIDWPKASRLVTTFAAVDGSGHGTVFVQDASGARTPVAEFAALPGDGPDTERWKGTPDSGIGQVARDAVGSFTQEEFLRELAEGGIERRRRSDGVRAAHWMPGTRLVLDLTAPDLQHNHVKRNVSVEPPVLAAVAHGVQLVAKRAGMPRWANLVPHRMGEVAVSVRDIADVVRVVLDLVPGDGGLGGRILLLNGTGRLVGELTDVWWGDEDAAMGEPHLVRRTVPDAFAAPPGGASGSMNAPASPPTGAGMPTGAASADSGTEAVEAVADELRVIAAGILGFEADEIEATTRFHAFGFDSISLVALAEQVSERFDVPIGPAILFDLDTLDALSRHLVTEFDEHDLAGRLASRTDFRALEAAVPPPGAEQPLATAHQPVAAPHQAPTARPAAAAVVEENLPNGHGTQGADGTPMPVAVVGAASRFPGARDLDAYWANLIAGVDSVGAFPLHRYDGEYAAAAEAADFPRHAAVLDDVDSFDAGFFRIYPREAELLDPQHRLALETVWSALEDSAYRPADLPVNTGVFLGVSGNDYATLLSAYGVEPDAFTATGNAHSMLANRVSFVLDVQGPSEPIDTACSSSLVAVHRALESIRSGTCDMAIAGGVNLLLSTGTFVSAHRAGMLSPDGRCKTFSDAANGYVRGEGVGAVVLKPLAAAERDGDAILGVLLGSAENHGGRANSLTAPNAGAQADVVAAAVGDTDPDTIGYIETHGTGTALGDPVEVRALRSAFRRLGATNRGVCGLGSVKTNIGHLEAAAGIASLLKVLLAMKHGVLPATLHCREVNPYIELDGGPFHLVRENETWRALAGRDGTPAPRRAGVSSFGFGGSNCHLVVEEYTAGPDTLPSDDGATVPAVVVPLSARTQGQLCDVARNLLTHLGKERHAAVPLASLAWSLQAGREAMDERVGWVVETHERLVKALEAFVTDGRVVHGGARGTVERSGAADAQRRATADDTAGDGSLQRILLDWVQGAQPDWRALYGARTPRRAHLPTYPFARERHWIPGQATHSASAPAADQALAAPLSPDTDAGSASERAGTVLLVPRWAPQPITVDRKAVAAPARRVVVLHDDAGIAPDALEQDPGVRYVTVASKKKRPDSWFRDVTWQYLEIVRAAAADERPGRALVQAVIPAGGPKDMSFALTGLMRTAMAEFPHMACQIIGCEEPWEAEALGDVLAAEARESDDVVLYRDGARLVRAWEPAENPPPGQEGPLRPAGVYLITGGAGGVGSVVARWIAAETVRATVVLVGRSPQDAVIEALVDELRATGAVARYAQADISRWEETRHLISGVREEFGRIDGVFHAAGVIQDSGLITKTNDEWEDVLAPKSDGLLNLDRALGQAPLDFLIAFSSGAAVTGNPGQSDYATANAFLDEFAAIRNARVAAGERSGRTMSIAWPLWEDGGMEVSPAALSYLRSSRGLTPMSSTDGTAVLSRAWRLAEDRVWVHHGRLADVPATARRGSAAGSTRSREEASPRRDDGESLRRLVQIFARVTKTPAHAVDVDQPLGSAGLDSIMVIQLNRELVLSFGDVPRTLFYDLPTLRAIAERLASVGADASALPAPDGPAKHAADGLRVPRAGTAAPATVCQTAPRDTATPSSPTDEPIAVIGMSGRYPQADDLDTFWANLRAGRDCIAEVPADRWPLAGFYERDRNKAVASGLSYSKWGGFLEDFASFDPLFFQIAPRDAYVRTRRRGSSCRRRGKWWRTPGIRAHR